jgi:hypothetical protein
LLTTVLQSKEPLNGSWSWGLSHLLFNFLLCCVFYLIDLRSLQWRTVAQCFFMTRDNDCVCLFLLCYTLLFYLTYMCTANGVPQIPPLPPLTTNRRIWPSFLSQINKPTCHRIYTSVSRSWSRDYKYITTSINSSKHAFVFGRFPHHSLSILASLSAFLSCSLWIQAPGIPDTCPRHQTPSTNASSPC